MSQSVHHSPTRRFRAACVPVRFTNKAPMDTAPIPTGGCPSCDGASNNEEAINNSKQMSLEKPMSTITLVDNAFISDDSLVTIFKEFSEKNPECDAHMLLDIMYHDCIAEVLSNHFVPDYCTKQEISSIDLLNKIKITTSSAMVIQDLEYWKKDVNRSVWDTSTKTVFDSRIRSVPMCMTISIDNMVFYFWIIAKWSYRSDSDLHYYVMSYNKKNSAMAEALLSNLSLLNTKILKRTKSIEVYGGSTISIGLDSTWDDLILSPDTIRKTRMDLEGWIASEDRYKKLNMPYKRGYLFEGPPGNGKTAVSRVIMSQYPFSCFAFEFSNTDMGDSHLRSFFADAAKRAPALILLEDIDRLFDGAKRSEISRITIGGLLNCLDGAAAYNGIVVIATANHPELLDPAIRLRPGRFDIPVRFDNPDYALRVKYFKHILSRCEILNISDECISNISNATEGFSVAFLKSIFESAAHNTMGKITEDALLTATDQVLQYYTNLATSSERSAGFTSGRKQDTSRINKTCGQGPIRPADETSHNKYAKPFGT